MNQMFMKKLLAPVLAIGILWGCGTLPDIVSTEKKEGQKYSADEVRQMTVDQPFQISGDYFRERDQKPSRDLGKLFSKKPEKKTDAKSVQTETQQPVPKPENTDKRAAVSAAPAPVSEVASATSFPVSDSVTEKKTGVSFPVKIGFIMDKEKIAPDTVQKILQTLPAAAQNLPVISADREKIEEVMSRSACPQRDLQCLSAALSLYPGVRMLILIESFDLPKDKSGNIKTRIGVVDAGLLFRYPTMEINLPLAGKDPDAAIAAILHEVLDFAVKKSQIMPWFCRAFSSDKGEWYISAGSITGLKTGQELRIISPGKVIQSPIGMPAGWIPGEVKGQVAVKQLFGEDFAVCTLKTGKGPEPEDLLVMP